MLKMMNLKLLLEPAEIKEIIRRMGQSIREDYASKNPVLIGVMNGSFIFLADLLRELDMPLEVDFIRTTCYGANSTPADKACITKDIEIDVRGKDVLIVEDIIDRGVTYRELISHIEEKRPKSIKFCALLLRDNGSAASAMKIDYCGKVVGKGFVVGYGLDYKEKYRNLPGIYVMED